MLQMEESGDENQTEMVAERTSREKPPWCEVIRKSLPFLVHHLNDVETIALRLYKENIMPDISCNNIVKNFTKKGAISAGEELLMVMIFDALFQLYLIIHKMG